MVAILAGALVAVQSPATADPAALGEIVILHAPVVAAEVAQPVTVDAVTRCDEAAPCAMEVVYRTTGGGSLSSGPWVRRTMQVMDKVSVVGGAWTRWTATIPGGYVDSTGVDYYLEATQSDGSFARSPDVTGSQPPELVRYHVTAVAPPIPVHVPPLVAPGGADVPIDLTATCSTGSCTARLYYRPSGAASAEALTAPDPGWPSVAMAQGGVNPVTDSLVAVRYEAVIPAASFTATGADYFMAIEDGKTTTYWPGTVYQGVLPLDGIRVAYGHVEFYT